MAYLIHNLLPVPPRKIIYIHPNDSMKKCIKLMMELNIGALVVKDNDKQLIGMVSERDVVAAVHKGLNPETTSAKDIAFADVTILGPHDTVEMAMHAITKTRRRHLLIAAQDEHIAILSIGDLLHHLLDEKTRTIEQLENYIHTY